MHKDSGQDGVPGTGFPLPLETTKKKTTTTKKTQTNKPTKYGFQTLNIREHRTVVPKVGQQIKLALSPPHLTALREFSGCRTGRTYPGGTDILPEFASSHYQVNFKTGPYIQKAKKD